MWVQITNVGLALCPKGLQMSSAEDTGEQTVEMIRVSRKTVDNVWPPHVDFIQVAWN